MRRVRHAAGSVRARKEHGCGALVLMRVCLMQHRVAKTAIDGCSLREEDEEERSDTLRSSRRHGAVVSSETKFPPHVYVAGIFTGIPRSESGQNGLVSGLLWLRAGDVLQTPRPWCMQLLGISMAAGARQGAPAPKPHAQIAILDRVFSF